MSRIISVRVNGIPAPQGSKRHVGGGRMVESSTAVGPWREAVRAQTQLVVGDDGPIEGPVDVVLSFYLLRPKGHFGARGLRPSAPRRPGVKPDLDKLVRSTLDGLVAGGALEDDARIVGLVASKHYAVKGSPVGMTADILWGDDA